MTILDLEALREKLPPYVDHTVKKLGTFRIARLGLTAKLRTIDLLKTQMPEEGGDLDESETVRLWSEVIASALINEAGEFCFDNEEGRELVQSIASDPKEFEGIITAMTDANRLGVELLDAEVEEAKNE